MSPIAWWAGAIALTAAYYSAGLFSFDKVQVVAENRKRVHLIRTSSAVIGVGLGLFLGNLLAGTGVIDEEVAIPSLILICGGGGLLLGNYYANKIADENENKA